MTIILTPSWTLQNSEVRCEQSQIECQISGARVCIDSLSACDGVPNCGSFGILPHPYYFDFVCSRKDLYLFTVKANFCKIL